MPSDLVNQAGFDEGEVQSAEDGGRQVDGVCGGERGDEEVVDAVDDTIGSELYNYHINHRSSGLNRGQMLTISPRITRA